MWRGLAAGRDGGGGGLVRAPFDRLRANGLLSVQAELVEALMEGLGARALRQAQGERWWAQGERSSFRSG